MVRGIALAATTVTFLMARGIGNLIMSLTQKRKQRR
jgi:hypothetical protein